MTTRLSKPVTRGPLVVERHGELIVTLAPEGVYYREKGRRKSNAFLLPHGVAFMRAVNLHLAQQRAEKKAARATRKRR